MTHKHSSSITFTCIHVGWPDYPAISSIIDSVKEEDHARVWAYDDLQNDWEYSSMNFNVSAITKYKDPQKEYSIIVCLSNEGNVRFFGNDEAEPFEEKIPKSGVFSKGAEGLGYMTGLNQIGDHLYACGGRCQVYKRQGPKKWIKMDEGIRQKVDTPIEDCRHLSDINGPSETEIYASGDHGTVLFWDGGKWSPVECPNYADLGQIYVESPDIIWIVGSDGTLLKGNIREGFFNVSPLKELVFTGVAKCGDLLYLSSDHGLYGWDGKNMKRVKTGLKPEHTDTHSVGCKDGVLWSVGRKDVVRLKDGKWTRIDHADNPPIR